MNETTTKNETALLAPGLWEKEDAAAFLRLSTTSVLALVRADEFPHLRIGRSLRFRREGLDAYLGELASQSRTEAGRKK